jgi:hypothetical protein
MNSYTRRLLCIGVFAGLTPGCGESQAPPSEPAISAPAPGDESASNEIDALLSLRSKPAAAVVGSLDSLAAQRRDLDETVWAAEKLSHDYEATFVRLWDDLLAEQRKGASANPLAVFKAVALRSIKLGEPADSRRYEHDISVRRLDGDAKEFSAADWRGLLNRLHDSGYRLEQSEWHHAAFDPPIADEPARSTVTFALYGVNQKRKGRWVLQGRLKIAWDRQRDSRGNPIPATVDATDIEFAMRPGPPAFEEILTVDPSRPGQPSGVQPVLVYDLDGDGLSEIIAVGCDLKYVNKGGNDFAREPFLDTDEKFFETGLLADLNGDGHADFASVDVRQRNLLLFPGDAKGRFTAAAIGRGETDSPLVLPQVIAAGDIDGDGDLDLWVAQYKFSYVGGQMPTPYYDANDGFGAYLLRNDDRGRFTDITEHAGLEKKRYRRTYGSSFVDLDDDGDLDLLVVSDFSGIDIYENDGQGKFTDVTAKSVDEWHNFGMSATFGDFNRDGRLDFYVTGMASTTARRLEHLNLGRGDLPEVHKMRPIMGYGSRMYLGGSDGRFSQPDFRGQVNRTGWTWGSTNFDFDNDGDRDIFVGNGHSSGQSTKDHCSHFWCHDIYTNDSTEDPARNDLFNQVLGPYFDRRESWDGYQKNVLLMNLAGKGFTSIAWLLGVGHEYDARAVVSDDLDADGRVDLIVVEDRWREGQILHVYRNQLPTAHHWIGVRLREEGPGKSPLGCKVIVHMHRRDKPGGSQQVGVVTCGDSIHAQHASTLHFGLGPQDRVDAIEVRWPSGKTRRIEKPAVNRYHRVRAE